MRVEAEKPHDPQAGHEEKCDAPSEGIGEHHDQQWSDGAAPAGEHPDQSLREAAFAEGEPLARGAADVGEGSGFACAKEKTEDHQAGEVPRSAGERGEGNAAEDDAREDFARAEAVAEPSAGDFEERIGEREGRERVGGEDGREVEAEFHVRADLDDADASDVGDGREAAQPGQHLPAHTRWPDADMLLGGLDGGERHDCQFINCALCWFLVRNPEAARIVSSSSGSFDLGSLLQVARPALRMTLFQFFEFSHTFSRPAPPCWSNHSHGFHFSNIAFSSASSSCRSFGNGGRTGPAASPTMFIISFITVTSYPRRRARIAYSGITYSAMRSASLAESPAEASS